MASVAIGLFAGIFVLGLYDGMMKARVRTVIDTEVGHLQIHRLHFKEDYDPSLTFSNVDKMNPISKMKDVKGVAHRSITQGMLATATGSAGVQVNGILMDEENIVSSLDKKIKQGEVLNLKKKNGILVGKKLADKMKLKVGSKLVLTFTDKESNITSGAFRVAGIYQTTNDPMDELNVYVHRTTLNSYLGIQDEYHEVTILLKDDQEIGQMKNQLQKMFPLYDVKNWKENSPETDLMVSTIDQYSTIIIVIIMIALAFGIINTMLMSVLERTREIGMLTALGMNRTRVFFLVLSETVLLTIVGVPVGLFSAWFTIGYLSVHGIDISSFSGAAMSGFGFSSIIYPEFPTEQILTVLNIVVATALVSSLFPSIKAIKLQPADALRQ
jgi:ABC-type lipoprotein release transport system permease subunit